MIYFLPFGMILAVWAFYVSYLWLVRERLYMKVKEAREAYSLDRHQEFLTDLQLEAEEDHYSVHTGLFRSRPEFQKVLEERRVYLSALLDFAEFSRFVLGSYPGGLFTEELHAEDDMDIWTRYMEYDLGKTRWHRFSYFGEFLRALIPCKRPSL